MTLKGFAAEAVERVRGEVALLTPDQKRVMSFLQARGSGVKLAEIGRALYGRPNLGESERKAVQGLLATGLVVFENTRYRYIAAAFVRRLAEPYGPPDRGGLSEEELAQILHAIEVEFAHAPGARP